MCLFPNQGAWLLGGLRYPSDLMREPWLSREGDRNLVIAMYRRWLLQQPNLLAALPELRGKDLVCWCAPERCHGDILIELANSGPTS